jgi:hypothetical protein
MTETTTPKYHTCLRCGSTQTQEQCTNCGGDTRTPFGSKPRPREEWRRDARGEWAIAVIPA